MSPPSEGLELPRHPFGSVREAASELRDAAARAGEHPLYLLPFNRYDPDDTDWWLSPEPENPAYKYGKVVLTASEAAVPGDLFVGLVFEKGIGPTAAEFFATTARGQRWLVDRTWAWERSLMPALRSGAFADASVTAEAAAGIPLTVVIDAAYAKPPSNWEDSDDVHSMDWPRDVVRFECSSATLTLIDADLPAELLGGLVEAEAFPAMESVLSGLPKVDWAWIDFHIGVRLGRSVALGAADWSAAEIWRRACQAWAGWVR